jgi:glycosyltransferase involved in cell wall biosynthesis
MVAVSKEVFQLKRYFPGSCAFGVSPHYALKLSAAHRSFGVHVSLYPLFRKAIPVLERCFHLNHVYTSLADWHFLSALGRRPIVLTITEPGTPRDPRLLEKISHVTAESERLAALAVQAGISPDRVSITYPGVDLEVFRETVPPPGPWKCLYASSPENIGEMHSKGVDLLLDLAAVEPQLQITLLWRPFGPDSERALDQVRQRGLPNVIIRRGRIKDIHRWFGQFHFTIAPYRSYGKPCPNSVVESMAAGRPVLVAKYVDIGDLIRREGAGLVFEPTLASLREAFRLMREKYPSLQGNARRCAEKYFDLRRMIRTYKQLYKRLLSRQQWTQTQSN